MKNFVYVCFFINTIKVQSMRKMLFITLLMGGLCTTVSVAKAQERLPEYLQAEKYTQEKLNTMLFSTVVDPHWFQKGNNFWFEYKTSEGTFWYVVDPVARTKKLLFDRDELASQLTEIVKDPFEARHLPIINLKAKEDGRTFTFEVKSTKDATPKTEGKDKKDKKDEKIEELTDRLTRQMAEFDNFRKRSEKEKSQMYEIGAKDIIEKILPVVDNFERGLDSIPEEEKGSPFAEGMEKIYKQLMTTLDSLGVKPIKAVGQEFNPDFHNAVMHVEDEEFGENVVAEEFQKGYMYRESVVRHSMVKVAN